MDRYLFDTNVIINHLKGNSKIVLFLKLLEHDEKFYSVITEIEIYSNIRESEKEKTDLFFSHLKSIEVTKEIATASSEYMQRYSKSHNLELPDAVISATAKVNALIFLTSNTKHFPMKDIRIINPKL